MSGTISISEFWDPLRVTDHETCSLGWLYKRMKGEVDSFCLNLDPDYQRDHVWTDAQAEAFIGHVIEGGEVPPIIINARWREHMADEVLDGKQRITAVVRWFDGEIQAELTDGRRLAFTDLDAEALPCRCSAPLLEAEPWRHSAYRRGNQSSPSTAHPGDNTMKLPIPFTEINAAYPEVVAEAIAGLRKGKSKDRNVAPEDMEWALQWGVRVEGDTSFVGLLARVQETSEEREAKWRAEKSMPVADRLAGLLRRIPIVSIMGSYKRAYAQATLPKGEHPPALVEHLTASLTAQWEADQRLLAQTPEEREQAAQEALAALTGRPGFMAFGVKS
jgi:hypothetical protein